MAGCKRKLSDVDDGIESASLHTRRSQPFDSRLHGQEASGSDEQSANITMRNAKSYGALELLPAEILLNIFPRCRNPCLSHVSSRLHQILPAFREVSKSLAGFAMAALPYSDGDGEPAKLEHLPIWRVVRELYTSRWVGPPETLTERLALQREVFYSCWFKEHHFMKTHFLTYYKLLDKVFLEDACFKYRLGWTPVTPRERFELSKGQTAKVMRLIKGEAMRFITRERHLLYYGSHDLNLRTTNAMGQALQIDINNNGIYFRTGKSYHEVYMVTSISHVPSFIYDRPIRHSSADLFCFITDEARGRRLGFDHVVEEAKRRLFCSRDKLRQMFNRVIDDAPTWSQSYVGPRLVRALLSLDKLCFRDQGRFGVVDYALYRKTALRNLPDALEKIFEHMSHYRDCLPNYKTLEQLSEAIEGEDSDVPDRDNHDRVNEGENDERTPHWKKVCKVVMCIDKHALDLYRLHSFNNIRAEFSLSPLTRAEEIDEITGCGGP